MIIEENGKKWDSLQGYMEELFDVKVQPHRIIKFKPIYGATGNTLKIQPAKDMVTKQFLGVKLLSEEQKRRVTYSVNDDTTFELKPGAYLDLGNIVDCINWKWIQHSKGVALSQEEADFRADVYYFVFDEAKESQKSLVHSEAVRDALIFVSGLPDADLSNTARLLGEKLDTLAPEAIREFLYGKAKHPNMEEIKRILALRDDPDTNIKKRINSLVDKGLIKIINGVYKFQKIDLGIGLDQTVIFFKNPQNEAIVASMWKAMYPELFDANNPFAPSSIKLQDTFPAQQTQREVEDTKNKTLEEVEANLTKLKNKK